jgi:superfamily I DNA/RNA helicase
MIDKVCRRIFPQRRSVDICIEKNCNFFPKIHGKCFIKEKTIEQLNYVISSIKDNIFLKPCPGSGKTEVVGIKAGYEFQAWTQNHNGIAILTFINNAADVIQDRVRQFTGIKKSAYPHFIGTIDSLANILSQRFPFIIIDECQDLSWIQLEIFRLLKQHGTSLHLVGYLNQAIYEFKKVNPKKVNEFVSHHRFKLLQLTDNFRSCQSIVDLCKKLVKSKIGLIDEALEFVSWRVR